MIPYKKLILGWLPLFSLIVAGAFVDGFENWGSPASVVCRGSSALLAVISVLVARCEISIGSRVVFVNFAIFFGGIALLTPIFQISAQFIININEWTRFYFYEYNLLAYFFLLSLCVVYLVFDHILSRLAVWRRFIVTLLMVGGVTLYLFAQLITDPLYLTQVPEFKNLKSLRKAIEQLKQNGKSDPKEEEILALAHFVSTENSEMDVHLTHGQQIKYLNDGMRYSHGDDAYMLLYRALWKVCLQMSLFDLLAVVLFVVYKFIKDDPEAAYFEKITWCIVPFLCFEALHHYVFITIHSYESYMKIITIGGYLSTVIIWMLFFLFGARLRFILSAEGEYYERRLIGEPDKITRWRDALDNWMVRKFIRGDGFRGRFVIRRKSDS